jgi:hypothetical protein
MREKPDHTSVWHEGELAVRRRAGVGDLSDSGIRSSIPLGAGPFIAQQTFAAFGSVDGEGRVWASLRIGPPGFLQVADEQTLQTASLDVEGDPLLDNLRSNPQVGMVIIDFENRRRLRVNGEAEVLSGSRVRILVRQFYGNCPQYIQQRTLESESLSHRTSLRSRSEALSSLQQQWIASADTLFIASAHPNAGVDASHRGGNQGFIQVEGPTVLRIPDYSGNNMFNTLGNINLNPKAGLVFPDFEVGRTLQLSGRAFIDWQPERSSMPGAQRVLLFHVEHVIEIAQPQLKNYSFAGYSGSNPPL